MERLVDVCLYTKVGAVQFYSESTVWVDKAEDEVNLNTLEIYIIPSQGKVGYPSVPPKFLTPPTPLAEVTDVISDRITETITEKIYERAMQIAVSDG